MPPEGGTTSRELRLKAGLQTQSSA